MQLHIERTNGKSKKHATAINRPLCIYNSPLGLSPGRSNGGQLVFQVFGDLDATANAGRIHSRGDVDGVAKNVEEQFARSDQTGRHFAAMGTNSDFEAIGQIV